MSLSITDVTKRYKIRVTGAQVNALNGVTIDLPAKQTLGIVGESGCGKSTLLNMVSGFATPTDGLVTVGGKRITEPGPDRMVVFQNYLKLKRKPLVLEYQITTYHKFWSMKLEILFYLLPFTMKTL